MLLITKIENRIIADINVKNPYIYLYQVRGFGMDIALVRNFFQNRTAQADPGAGNGKLIDDIEEIKRDIVCCDEQFDLTDDFDLMEYFIYERKALMSRYRFLLNQAKLQGAICAMEKMIKINEKGE